MDRMESPIGSLLLVWREETLCALSFDYREERMAASLKARFGEVELVRASGPNRFRSLMEDYFAGDLAVLEGIAVETGGTPFQQNVWRLLREIPAGKTASYGELAAKLNTPGASRAVGMANNRNPVAIVVPCHRVIGANGSMIGYGGGLDRKRWLLAHESGWMLR